MLKPGSGGGPGDVTREELEERALIAAEIVSDSVSRERAIASLVNNLRHADVPVSYVCGLAERVRQRFCSAPPPLLRLPHLRSPPG